MSLVSFRASAVVAAGTSLLLLGGCANLDQMLESQIETIEFDCDDDRDIRVGYLDGGEEVRLFSGDSSVELRLVDTRNGGNVRVYENRNGSVRMVDNGERIQVRVEGKDNFEDCEPDDPRYRRGGSSGAF